jgi:phage shock protein A
MGIATRVLKICKADIHGMMDQLEDKGLLLKQYLRDMKEALEHKEARLKKLNVSLSQARRERDNYNQEIEKLEQDLETAIKKAKDTISRLLIRKIKSLTRLRDDIDRYVHALDQQMGQFKDCIDQQRIQYAQLKIRATEYFHPTDQKEWEKTQPTFPPGRTYPAPSDEEIELELIQRKEAILENKGGMQK